MSNKLKSKRDNMTTNCCEVEQPKHLKKRIKDVKHDLSMLVNLADRGLVDYNISNQAVGSMYIELTRLKRRLVEAKRHG